MIDPGTRKTMVAPTWTGTGSDWRHRAACRGTDTDLFFPHTTDDSGLADAKATCQRCPRGRRLPTVGLGNRPDRRRLGRHVRG